MIDYTGLRILVIEIDRQLQVLSERGFITSTSPRKCITTLLEEDNAYRDGLLQLRKEVLGLSCNPTSEPKDHRPLAKIASCIWRFPAYIPPSFALIQPEAMIKRVTDMSRVQQHENDGHEFEAHIWADKSLSVWASQESSSIIIIQGSSQSIHRLRDFSCDFVNDLIRQDYSHAYILNSMENTEYFKYLNTTELLRQLACQLLRTIAADISTPNLVGILQCFQSASTTQDWFEVFRALLRTRASAFIVIDASVLQEQAGAASAWVQEFKNLFDVMTKTSTICIKVMILSCRKIADTSSQPFSPCIVIDVTKIFPEETSRLCQLRRDLVQPLSFFVAPHTPNNLDNGSKTGNLVEEMIPGFVQLQDEGPQQLETVPANDKTPSADFGISDLPVPLDFAKAPFSQHQRQYQRRKEVRVAIFCALPLEADTIRFLCDEPCDPREFGKVPGDTNFYDVVRIGGHKVVIVIMPGPGKMNATASAVNCLHSFENIRLALLTGICGGIPSPYTNTEIYLGDVVVSDRLVVHDFGRRVPGGFERKDTIIDNPRKPLIEIAGFLRRLESQTGHEELSKRMKDHLKSLRKDPQRGKWAIYPGVSRDVAYEATYLHKHHSGECGECGLSPSSDCEVARKTHCALLGCDEQRTMSRKRHQANTQNQCDYQRFDTVVHIGAYASGDTVMKSAGDRDEIGWRDKVIAFEMEGPGIWDIMPTIIVKGVCDYADSHKNKDWQKYAATAAATCVKALLEIWQ